MTTLTHLDANPRQNAADIPAADRAGAASPSMNREHRLGLTVDQVDQVSSVTLLGMAVAGSMVMLATHWLVG
ncbi:hypothetical protein ASF49_05065 [Methylobacterium sp. Leaf104]|uniref:hypothetical protein n=1 Tax=Methylobacterium TaxID=407 RepID=UPI0006FDEB66|nr:MULTISPECIES: hypothetical protein [Methylobacterium]KQP38374.1 hypothetical protein ASF49_05065 [Methylobacterium sp. Leaf104]MCI9880221.1 hypothetical protein [Methylobacterium goesingense]